MTKTRDYRHLYGLPKRAAAVLTPEAEQAAVQPPMPPPGGMPPMDPSMMGGMPPQGAMPPPGGMPMDPSMMGAMPPPGGMPPMDPSMMGGMPPQGAMPPAGGAIPPEIMQDQMFMQFLSEVLGVQMDPNSGMFIDPNGQPVPPELLMQIYQQFQQQAASMQQQDPNQPLMPGGGEGGMPPAGAQGVPDAMKIPDVVLSQISDAVVSGVEAVIQDVMAATEHKISALMEKVETLKSAIEMLTDTTDMRAEEDINIDQQLRDELAAELMPEEQVPKAASVISATEPKHQQMPVSLFDVIRGSGV